MDRRDFVKTMGVGGLLVGLGAIAGLGCATEDAPVTGPPQEGDTKIAICPDCDEENRVEQWGQKIKCWKCGHVWAPQKTA
jgi:hypothetical protein